PPRMHDQCIKRLPAGVDHQVADLASNVAVTCLDGTSQVDVHVDLLSAGSAGRVAVAAPDIAAAPSLMTESVDGAMRLCPIRRVCPRGQSCGHRDRSAAKDERGTPITALWLRAGCTDAPAHAQGHAPAPGLTACATIPAAAPHRWASRRRNGWHR